MTGKLPYVKSNFDTSHKSVLKAGSLFGIPALISQGLGDVFKVYNPLPNGFYGLTQMILLSCFMAFCRIKNSEQLKQYAPGEFGKMLGLDRIPEVGYFRKKIKQIIDQNLADCLHSSLFKRWLAKLPELFFYIDGHVRVYHGNKANLPKKYVSREKLCLNGTTEYWVNDQQGLPLMVVAAELNEKLKEGITQAIKEFNQQIVLPQDNTKTRYTIVFDRESYEPKWFKSLWDDHQVAIISYRKNVKDTWGVNTFKKHTLRINESNVAMQLSEMGVCLNGMWFREIRKLSSNGHQVAIISTNLELSIEQIATKMFARWTQENYFKYMIENFDFDKIIEYGAESIDPKIIIPNPEYRKITYQLKKLRESKNRLQARVLIKMENQVDKTIDYLINQINSSCDLIEKINNLDQSIQELIEKRKKIKSRITIDQMPEGMRYNKLKQESKKFRNAILMLAFRAESSLVNSIAPFYKNTYKDGRMLIKEIFSSEADIIPDQKNKILTIRIHSLSTPRYNVAVKKLCDILNETETIFPDTNLKLIYESVAV